MVLIASPLMPGRARAQSGDEASSPPVHHAHLLAGGGVSFPSGGNSTDTYRTGVHSFAAVTYGVRPGTAFRAEVTYARYSPHALHGMPPLDPHWARVVSATVNLVTHLPRDARPYVIGGGGFYQVRGTWLRPEGDTEPVTTRNTIGGSIGAGTRLGPRLFLEARHHLAYRSYEGTARYIPITLGWTF